MSSPWWSPKRAWGFRFSRWDLVIVLMGSLTTLAAIAYSSDLAITVPFVLGHFFLFCNVLRVGRTQELIWGGLLFVNVGGWLILGRVSWMSVFFTQCFVTLFVVIHALRQPDYHGIGCQRINPLGYRPDTRRRLGIGD